MRKSFHYSERRCERRGLTRLFGGTIRSGNAVVNAGMPAVSTTSMAQRLSGCAASWPQWFSIFFPGLLNNNPVITPLRTVKPHEPR